MTTLELAKKFLSEAGAKWEPEADKQSVLVGIGLALVAIVEELKRANELAANPPVVIHREDRP